MTPAAGEWEPLVERARAVLGDVADRGATITYERLATELGVEYRDSGTVPLADVLRAVSVSEDDAGRGLLTAVVVRRSGLPGAGFFRLAAERGRDVGDRRAAWQAELRRVHAAVRPRGPARN